MLFDLPSVLACEVLGKWLELIDVGRLDTAFCNKEKRSTLLECVSHTRHFEMQEKVDERILKWHLIRMIPSNTILVSNDNQKVCAEYVRTYGPRVHTILLRGCNLHYNHLDAERSRSSSSNSSCSNFSSGGGDVDSVLGGCVNIRSMVLQNSVISDLQSVVATLNTLVSLEVRSTEIRNPTNRAVSGKKVQVSSVHVDSHTESHHPQSVLDVCELRSIRKLQVVGRSCTVALRGCTSLRSLGMNTPIESLTDSLRHCSQIVNLDLSRVLDMRAGSIAAISAILLHLRSINFEWQAEVSDDDIHELVNRHHRSLEAVYLSDCEGVSPEGVNFLLTECPHLHTFSFSHALGVQYFLLCNLTTLITNCPENDSEWHAIQQHCSSVQHLHFHCHTQKPRHVRLALPNCWLLPSLRVMHFHNLTNAECHDMRDSGKLTANRPEVRVVFDADNTWYHLLSMPI